MLSTEALVDLGENLRRRDFELSSHELIAAHHVLAGLARRDKPPGPRELAPYLAPVFCRTPEQQQQFLAFFATWVDAWAPGSRPAEVPPSPPRPPPEDPRWPEWSVVVLILLVILTLAAALWLWLGPQRLAVRVEGEDGQPLAARVHALSAGRSAAVSPNAPVTILKYRRHHLPMKLRAEPEAAGFAAGDLSVESPVPAEVHIVLKRVAQTQDPPPPRKAPPGFTPAGSIAAATPETPASTLTPRAFWVPDHIVVVVGFLLLLAAGWTWNALRRRGWLERLPAGGRETEKRLQADRGELRSAFHDDLLHLGRELRRRRLIPSAQLDVERTIAATLRQGGLFTPIFGSRVEPEFLVLVDRSSLRDHLALLADELVRGLHERRLSVECFHYDRNPSRCRHQPLKQGARDLGSQDLGQLLARFGERRLIVFGDGCGLLDPYTGQAAASVDRLLAWGRPVLVTPRSQPEWGRQEWALERAGLTILPLGEAGLKLLGDVIARDRAIQPPDARSAERPRPAYLRDLDRLLDGEPPGEVFVSRVVNALEHDLPPAVFAWLAACAVYPEIHWGITLRVGDCLIPDARELVERLPALVQLPWLRHGSMPDWLRQALLARLPGEAQALIRARLDEFLAGLREAPADVGAVRIAAAPGPRRSAVGDVWRGLQALLRGKPAAAVSPAAEDRVFLRFMSVPANPLGVRASEALRRLFYRDGLPLAGMRPLPLLFAAALGVALLQHFFPLRDTELIVGPTPAPIVRVPTALALDHDGHGLLIGDSHRGLQAWQETGEAWRKVAQETSTVADAISAVALGAGRMLGAGKGGLQVRPAAIGGPADTSLAARLRADEIRSAGRYGDQPEGEFQLQAGEASTAAADELCLAIDEVGRSALSLGAGFLTGLVGGKHQAVACAVSHAAKQLAVLADDGSVFVLPLRAALPRTAAGGGGHAPLAKLPTGDWRRSLAVSADGTTVAATSADGRVLILRDVQAGPTLLDGLRPAGPVALSGDGFTLAFADSDRQVQVWRIEKPGRKVLLTIAVDALESSTRLQTPVADVRRVADVLERRYGFELKRLDNPSRAELLKALEELSTSLVPRDHLLIYFSGFASYADIGKSRKGQRSFNFYLPSGSRGASLELSGVELAARVAAIPARQILAIVDTPGAGELATLPKSAIPGSGARGLLYSAGADQFSNDTADFSTALANALATAPGPLTGRALATEVARRLPAEVRKMQTPGYADWLAAAHGSGTVLLVPIGPKRPELPLVRLTARVQGRQADVQGSPADVQGWQPDCGFGLPLPETVPEPTHSGYRCLIIEIRKACPGREKESYKKCDGKAACAWGTKAGSERSCASDARKSCENLGDRQQITESKCVFASYKGVPVEGGKNFCDKIRPDFNRCLR